MSFKNLNKPDAAAARPGRRYDGALAKMSFRRKERREENAQSAAVRARRFETATAARSRTRCYSLLLFSEQLNSMSEGVAKSSKNPQF